MLSRYLTVLVLLFSLPVMAASAPCWRPYVEGTGYVGDYWRGGGLTGFVPFCCSPCGLAFVQGDVMDVDREGWVAIGGGYRRFISGDLALGLAGFFDYAHTHRRIHHSYYQGTIAGEAYYRCFEFRVNGYLANRNTNEKIYPTGEAIIDGTDILPLLDTVKQSPYSGFDLLAGYNLELACDCRLRGWAGYYDYTAHHAQDLRGPRIRAQAEFDDVLQLGGSRFVVGGIWQYDKHRKHQASLILSLRIPLGRQRKCCRCCCSSICRRLGDPVMRRPGILVRERENRDEIGPAIGQIVFFQEGAMGIGTQADPTSLQNALDITNPGDVLFGLANGGDIDVAAVSGSTLALQDRQQLWGFDSTTVVTITVDSNSFEITELSPAGRPRLVVPGGATDTVTLANRNIVDGLAIGGSAPSDGGDNGIFGSSINTIIIRNMTIDNTIGDGIGLVAGSSNTVIDNATITNIDGNGLFLDECSNTSIANVTIDSTQDGGIELDNSSNTSITNLTINDIATDGIFINECTTTQISNTMMSNVSNEGLVIDNSSDLVATNVTINLPGNTAIDATGTNENFSFANCSVTQSVDDSVMRLNTITGLEVVDSTFIHSGTLAFLTPMIEINGTGDYTFSNCDITKTNTSTLATQLNIDMLGTDGDVTISNCRFENDVAVGSAISFNTDGAVGARNYTFQDITMTNIDNFGIETLSANGNDENYLVSNCNYAGNGVGIGYFFAGETTGVLDIVLCENSTMDQTDGYSFTTGGGNTGAMNVLMEGNSSANSQDSGVNIVQAGSGGGMLNATVNNHEDLNSNLSATTNAAYQFQQDSSDLLCGTIQGCSSNTPNNQGIFYVFGVGAGPIHAFPSDTPAGLATANPGINGGAASITVDAGVTLAPGACATPNTTCPAP